MPTFFAIMQRHTRHGRDIQIARRFSESQASKLVEALNTRAKARGHKREIFYAARRTVGPAWRPRPGHVS